MGGRWSKEFGGPYSKSSNRFCQNHLTQPKRNQMRSLFLFAPTPMVMKVSNGFHWKTVLNEVVLRRSSSLMMGKQSHSHSHNEAIDEWRDVKLLRMLFYFTKADFNRAQLNKSYTLRFLLRCRVVQLVQKIHVGILTLKF